MKFSCTSWKGGKSPRFKTIAVIGKKTAIQLIAVLFLDIKGLLVSNLIF